MTAVVGLPGRRRGGIGAPAGRRARRGERSALPPLTPRLHLARALLVVVLFVSAGLALQVTVVSAFQQGSSQQRLFDRFRGELAAGTAPVGPADAAGRPLEVGDPVAFLEIPAIGLRQVVVEGTTSAALFAGPGHRRDTPLPGQAGVAVIGGRRAAFGGPFSRLEELDEGDTIQVTTGQGEFSFEVLGVRREGEPIPPPPSSGDGRLVLATAGGTPLLPDGVLRVDAELVSEAQPGLRRLIGAAGLPPAEELLAGDASRLWTLALWLQALVAVAVGAVWAWHRWGRAQAWVVFVPPLLLTSLYVANHTAQLLPNLL
jgi:hypothetical protein